MVSWLIFTSLLVFSTHIRDDTPQNEEVSVCTLWRTRFGRGYGPVARQTIDCMNGTSCTTLVHDTSGVYIGTLHKWGFLKIYSFTWNRLWNNKVILNTMKAFWTLALNGSARSTSHPDCLTPGERTSCTCWIKGWPLSWSGCSERRIDLVLQFLACPDLRSLVTVLPRLLIYGKIIWLHAFWYLNYN